MPYLFSTLKHSIGTLSPLSAFLLQEQSSHVADADQCSARGCRSVIYKRLFDVCSWNAGEPVLRAALGFMRKQHSSFSARSRCRHEPSLGERFVASVFFIFFLFVLAGLGLVIPVGCFIILLPTDYSFWFCYAFALHGISCCFLVLRFCGHSCFYFNWESYIYADLHGILCRDLVSNSI